MRQLEDKADPEETKLSIFSRSLNPSGTKGFGNRTKHQEGGVEMDHHKYLKKDKCYKPKTLGGVRRYPSRSQIISS